VLWKAPEAAFKESIARRRAVVCSPLAYMPRRIDITTHSTGSAQALVHGFLEAVDWLMPVMEKILSAATLRMIVEAAELCVRWVSKNAVFEGACIMILIACRVALHPRPY
jgi:hypothetical protein